MALNDKLGHSIDVIFIKGFVLSISHTQAIFGPSLKGSCKKTVLILPLPLLFLHLTLDYDFMCSEPDVFIQLQESPILPYCLLLLCQKY